MTFKLTHRNIRIRYLAAKQAARVRRRQGDRVPAFSYKEMGKLFTCTPQACYEWTKKKMPTGPRRELVYAWINDGAIEQFLADRHAVDR